MPLYLRVVVILRKATQMCRFARKNFVILRHSWDNAPTAPVPCFEETYVQQHWSYVRHLGKRCPRENVSFETRMRSDRGRMRGGAFCKRCWWPWSVAE